VDDAIATYSRAWNEQDPDQRRRLLERSVTDDAVLVDPTGRWEGVPGLAERIGQPPSSEKTRRSERTTPDAAPSSNSYSSPISGRARTS
jgi:hypothetical protein